jgi:hypothetical protein
MSGGLVFEGSTLSIVDAITQFVNGTQAVWNSITIPVPLGLVVYATDTTVVKMGDGITLYANLPTLFTLSSIITMTAQITALGADVAGIPAIVTEIATIMGEITALQTAATAAVTSLAAISSEITTIDGELTTLQASIVTITGGTVVLNTNTTLTTTQNNFLVECGGGTSYTVSIPTAVGNGTLNYDLFLNTAQPITFATSGGAFAGTTGNGEPTITLTNTTASYYTLRCDNTNWILTGVPLVNGFGNLVAPVPTAPPGDSSNKIANTAFVQQTFVTEMNVNLTDLTAITLISNQFGFGFLSFGGAPSGDVIVTFPTSGRWIVSNVTTGNVLVICVVAGQSIQSGVQIQPNSITEILGDGINILPINTAIKQKLSGNTTFFVNASAGSDTTGIGRTALPWKTLAHAISTIAENYDLAGFTATLSCTGAFTTGVLIDAPMTGQTQQEGLVIDGNGTATVIVNNGQCFGCSNGGSFVVQNWALLSTTGSVSGGAGNVFGCNVGSMFHQGNNFGACVGAHIATFSAGGNIFSIGNYTILSGAVDGHLSAGASSFITIGNNAPTVVTLEGTPNFPSGFAVANNGGVIFVDQTTFVNNATGPVYNLASGGIIQTLGRGATFFPGNSAGVNDGTGIYQ